MATYRALRFSFPGTSSNLLCGLRSHIKAFGTENGPHAAGTNWKKWVELGLTAAIAFGTITAACGTMQTATAVNEHRKAKEASQLYKEYAKVGKCLSEIGHFYQDRQRRKDDADKKPEEERTLQDRESIAIEWAQEKRSKNKKPTEEVRRIDECRQVTTNFFKNAYMLLEKGFLEKEIFEESFYARSGNFKRLVEPLDKANFDLVKKNPEETYTDGDNRPKVYVKIEDAEKDPATKNFF